MTKNGCKMNYSYYSLRWIGLYVNKFLAWHKKFGPTQKILGPVNGQGMYK